MYLLHIFNRKLMCTRFTKISPNFSHKDSASIMRSSLCVFFKIADPYLMATKKSRSGRIQWGFDFVSSSKKLTSKHFSYKIKSV